MRLGSLTQHQDKQPRWARKWFAWLGAALLCVCLPVRAQRLPTKFFDVAAGLPSSVVLRIVSDSRGFIWVCTRNGLSRFDGAQFVNYSTAEGLPNSTINDLLAARNGTYWVATNGGGVAQFNPNISTATATTPRFTTYSLGSYPGSNFVNHLSEDQEGCIWAATDHHVFRLDVARGETAFRQVELPVAKLMNSGDFSVNGLLPERNGAMWVGYTHANLFRVWPDGRMEDFTHWGGHSFVGVTRLLRDRSGSLWLMTQLKLFRLEFDAANQQPLSVKVFQTGQDGLSGFFVGIHELADGRIWANTVGGSYEFNGTAFRPLPDLQRLDTNGRVFFDAEDSLGNFWVHLEGRGIAKILRQGFTSWDRTDTPGLVNGDLFFQTPAGELMINSLFHEHWAVARLEGQRFRAVRLRMPKGVSAFWRGTGVYCDRQGEWWAASTHGLYRFGKLSQIDEIAPARAQTVYRQGNGLPHTPVSVIYEDRRSDLWLATTDEDGNNLTHWERATGTFRVIPVPNEIPMPKRPQTFAEDSAGNLWIGFDRAGTARYRNGQWQLMKAEFGWPDKPARAFHWDRLGRLWMGTSEKGVYLIEQPLAEQPRVTRHYSMKDGLSSDAVLSIVEDQWGRLYFATTQGVNRFDPARQTIRHFTQLDGLANDYVASAFRDQRGQLWFGTANGISRLIPEADPPPAPPPIYLNGLRIAGVPYGVSELGETSIQPLQLNPTQRNVELSFFGFSFGFGERLRFQYKLEGADREWSAPDTKRSVNYANLAPGHYRFLVRALNADGLASEPPATVSFAIAAPVYLRWWFLTLAGLTLGGLAYALYRYRLAQLLAVERVRTRIATDLHDDIGSNLTRIAMLSEVAQQQLQAAEANVLSDVSARLARVADISRESVDALGDIIWAINPAKSRLSDLVQRMRRVLDDLCAMQALECEFVTDIVTETLVLETDLRREVLLIFKEALNNAVRHAAATRLSVSVTQRAGELALSIRDDGVGFAPEKLSGAVQHGGHGLSSMRQRARALQGTCEIETAPQAGTRVTLRVPLHKR